MLPPPPPPPAPRPCLNGPSNPLPCHPTQPVNPPARSKFGKAPHSTASRKLSRSSSSPRIPCILPNDVCVLARTVAGLGTLVAPTCRGLGCIMLRLGLVILVGCGATMLLASAVWAAPGRSLPSVLALAWGVLLNASSLWTSDWRTPTISSSLALEDWRSEFVLWSSSFVLCRVSF